MTMVSDTQSEILRMVERWIRHELAILNRGAEAHGDVHHVIASCRVYVDAIAFAARGVRDPELAMRLLQLLAFAVSSAERHVQAAGAAPGSGVNVLAAAPVLVYLGEIAEHLPRDSHYTYWLQNDSGTPLTFTGSSSEARLIRILCEMHHLQSVSAAMLRPICAGETRITERRAIDDIELAAEHHDRIVVLLHSMLAPSPQRNGTSFELFAKMLKSYFVDYPIGMQTYLGPDPANMPAAIEMEMLIGPDEGRREAAQQRMPFLMRDDRTRIESAIQQPSLMMRVLDAADLNEDVLSTMSEEHFDRHIEQRPWIELLRTTFSHLIDAADTTASYFSDIEKSFRPTFFPLSTDISTAKTLSQRARSEYDTLPQLTETGAVRSAVRRLMKAR